MEPITAIALTLTTLSLAITLPWCVYQAVTLVKTLRDGAKLIAEARKGRESK